MKDFFLKNLNGWISLLIVIVTVLVVGVTRLLTRNLNIALVILFAASILATYFYNRNQS